jgi:hypothetical protein
MPKAYAFFLCALVLAGLAARPAAAGAPREPGRSPLTVQISGPAKPRAGQITALVITVQRTPSALIPFDMAIELPQGAKLVSGQLKEHVLDAKHKTLKRRLKLRLERVPERDVQVSAEARTDAWGAHATDAYRFGRPEPVLAVPATGGPEIRLNGKNLGRGIPIDGKAPTR